MRTMVDIVRSLEASSQNATKRFEAAKKRLTKMIVELANGAGADGNYRAFEQKIAKALSALDDRTNDPEIRGHEELREAAWAEVSALRQAYRDAQEVGYQARVAIRSGEIKSIREREIARIEEERAKDPAGYAYRQELKLHRGKLS
jgi:hypothetical protein